jgi:chromosome segregation ATPase
MEQGEKVRKLLTIKEYAAIKQVSVQAVYQRLNKSLKRYLIIENGVKMLDSAALDEPTIKGAFNSTFIQDSSDFQVRFNELESEKKIMQAKIDEQRETIERLKQELEQARDNIKHKDEQINELTQNVLVLAQNAQELARNSQVLQLQAQNKRKGIFARLFAPKEKVSN